MALKARPAATAAVDEAAPEAAVAEAVPEASEPAAPAEAVATKPSKKRAAKVEEVPAAPEARPRCRVEPPEAVAADEPDATTSDTAEPEGDADNAIDEAETTSGDDA